MPCLSTRILPVEGLLSGTEGEKFKGIRSCVVIAMSRDLCEMGSTSRSDDETIPGLISLWMTSCFFRKQRALATLWHTAPISFTGITASIALHLAITFLGKDLKSFKKLVYSSEHCTRYNLCFTFNTEF